MRFVFENDPSSVRNKLPDFSNEIQKLLAPDGPRAQPLTLNLYDTEFYSKFDGSLDFGRTSSCFQVFCVTLLHYVYYVLKSLHQT